MKAVLQYRASPGLRERIAALDFPTVIVDETDKDTFRREMNGALAGCFASDEHQRAMANIRSKKRSGP